MFSGLKIRTVFLSATSKYMGIGEMNINPYTCLVTFCLGPRVALLGPAIGA